MKLRLIIISLICLSVPTLLMAQPLTNKQRRQINAQVLYVIEEYERYASLGDEDAQYYFETLFTNDAQIQSDMIGAPSFLQHISVEEYVEQFNPDFIKGYTLVTIGDVVKGELEYVNDRWEIPVSFRKTLSYTDNNGYIFSIRDYYSRDVDVTMRLVYDEAENRCYIASLDSYIDTDKRFPEGRFYIVNKSQDNTNRRYRKYLSNLKFNGEPIEYSDLGYAFLSHGEFSLPNTDVAVSLDTLMIGSNYEVLSPKFEYSLLRLKPHCSWAPFTSYIAHKDDDVDAKSSALELGLDLGVAVPFGQKCKIGFYVGAGLNMSNLNLSLRDAYDYTYKDKKNELLYKITSASERVRYIDVCLPAYLDFEFLLNRNLLLTLDVGAKAYFNMSANVSSPFTIKYDVVDGDSTTTNTFRTNSFILPVTYAKKLFEFGAMANLGLNVDLHNGRIYWVIEAGYEQSFMDSYVPQTLPLGYLRPIVPQYNNEKRIDFAQRSLISGLAIRRNVIWLTTGLKFKM